MKIYFTGGDGNCKECMEAYACDHTNKPDSEKWCLNVKNDKRKIIKNIMKNRDKSSKGNSKA